MLANGTIDAHVFLGLANTDIIKGSTGKVITFGLLSGFNTSSFSVGDTLYLDPSNYGGLTATKPTGTNIAVAVAKVLTSSTTGSVFVLNNKFDENATSGGGSISVDSTLSTTSTNPVENQAITNEINTKQDTLTFGIANTNSLIVDGSASANQYAQFTSNGLVGSNNISANNIIATGLMYRNGALQTSSRTLASAQGNSAAISLVNVNFASQTVQDSNFFSYTTPTGSVSTGLQLKIAGYYQNKL